MKLCDVLSVFVESIIIFEEMSCTAYLALLHGPIILLQDTNMYEHPSLAITLSTVGIPTINELCKYFNWLQQDNN